MNIFAPYTDPAFANLPDSQNKIAEYYDRRSWVVMETNGKYFPYTAKSGLLF